MHKRTLVPLDGSALAEQALPYAIAQAKHFEAELILLQVLAPLASAPLLGEVARSRAEASSNALAREYLERVVASVQEQDTQCSRQLRKGVLLWQSPYLQRQKR
jgi:nucleotide-binding universal stress UspA family protein